MQPQNMEKTKAVISAARLSSYQKFFNCATDNELFGVYCWNIHLSACFYNLISIVEVALRNRFHFALSDHFSPGAISFDWYNSLKLQPKTANKIKKITHYKKRGRGEWIPKDPVPSADDVVSRLTFGVWKNLLDVEEDCDGNKIPWGNLIPKILVNHRTQEVAFWSREKNQDFLFARIGLVGDVRNRICHFEPIWKQGDLYEERRPRQGYSLKIEYPAPSSPSISVDRLRLIHNRMVKLLYWLSKARASDYTTSENCKKFFNICCDQGLISYKNLLPHAEIELNNIECLKNSICEKRMVKVIDELGDPVAFIYP